MSERVNGCRPRWSGGVLGAYPGYYVKYFKSQILQWPRPADHIPLVPHPARKGQHGVFLKISSLLQYAADIYRNPNNFLNCSHSFSPNRWSGKDTCADSLDRPVFYHRRKNDNVRTTSTGIGQELRVKHSFSIALTVDESSTTPSQSFRKRYSE